MVLLSTSRLMHGQYPKSDTWPLTSKYLPIQYSAIILSSDAIQSRHWPTKNLAQTFILWLPPSLHDFVTTQIEIREIAAVVGETKDSLYSKTDK